MKKKYLLHPWHGISYGECCPNKIVVFIEIVSTDTIKYEIDKISGYLMIDRPQKFSNIIPALYGFIPKTYCGNQIAELASYITKKKIISGDQDPLDVLVLTSHQVSHGNILLQAIPIGGFCMIDKNEADDKIIAVLVDDHVYGGIKDISELSIDVILRLKHYFLTYKLDPEYSKQKLEMVSIDKVYDSTHAKRVIQASIQDYTRYIVSEIK